jgi:hypothetical protein
MVYGDERYNFDSLIFNAVCRHPAVKLSSTDPSIAMLFRTRRRIARYVADEADTIVKELVAQQRASREARERAE